MRGTRTRALILPLCAALGVLGLILAPMTRWIVAAQLRSEFDFSPPVSVGTSIARAAQRHPADLDAAIAGIIFADRLPANVHDERSAVDVQLQKIVTLIDRHPDCAALYAQALRLMTFDRIKIRRAEERQMAGKSTESSEPSGPPIQANLRQYLDLALQGERLDPDNAYFPAMAAVALFAAHHDDDGLAALHRAAMLPHWRSYAAQVVQAAIRMQDDDGRKSGFAFMVPLADMMLPHFAQLRSVVRMAAYLAAQREAHKQFEAGLAIRRDIMRFGTLVRNQDSSAIGTLVGIALMAISGARVGGAPPPMNSANLSAEERRVRTERRYIDYLISHGRKEDAAQYHIEMERGREIKRLIDEGMNRSAINTTAVSLPSFWGVGLLLLSNLLVLLACHLLLQIPLSARVPGAVRRLLLLPVAVWQWKVVTIACMSLVLVVNGLEESPIPIPNETVFSSFVPVCFIAHALVNWLVWWRARKQHLRVTIEFRSKQHALIVATASVLSLAYVGVVGVTAVREEAMRKCMDRSARDEAHYAAELCGKPWPIPSVDTGKK